jgi:hypothetical protein
VSNNSYQGFKVSNLFASTTGGLQAIKKVIIVLKNKQISRDIVIKTRLF